MLLEAEMQSLPLPASKAISLNPILISDIMSRDQCLEIISLAHQEGCWRTSNFGKRLIYSLPRSVCEIAWQAICSWLPTQIEGRSLKGFFEPTAQLFWYQRGDHFPSHSDKAADDRDGGVSYFTVVIYLNDCKGGGTYFPDRNLVFQPTLGSALIFPQEMVHESQILESESKYILRAQVMYH